MQDRFKFRAKDIKTGEWRYGFYADLPFGLGSSGVNGEYGDVASFILSYEIKQSSLYSNAEPHEVVLGKSYIVNEKTICQSTGLKDKNGTLIYEGDIIKYAEFDFTDFSFKDWETEKAQVIYGNDYDTYYPAFDLKDKDFDGTNAFSYLFNEGWTIEVIGNIYENPELIEEQQ